MQKRPEILPAIGRRGDYHDFSGASLERSTPWLKIHRQTDLPMDIPGGVLRTTDETPSLAAGYGALSVRGLSFVRFGSELSGGQNGQKPPVARTTFCAKPVRRVAPDRRPVSALRVIAQIAFVTRTNSQLTGANSLSRIRSRCVPYGSNLILITGTSRHRVTLLRSITIDPVVVVSRMDGI